MAYAELDTALKNFGAVRIADLTQRYVRWPQLQAQQQRDANAPDPSFIGKGSFGSVFQVRHSALDGTPDLSTPLLVVKEILKSRVVSSSTSVQHLCTELAVTGIVSPGSPNLNRRVDLLHSVDKVWLVLERAGGPRPDIITRAAHIIALHKPEKLRDLDDIVESWRSKAAASGTCPNADDEETLSDWLDTNKIETHSQSPGKRYTVFEKLAIDCGVWPLDEINVAERPVSGALFDYIVACKRLVDPATRIIARQMLEGLKYLHLSGIVNRDVKPENVIIGITRKAVLKRSTAANGGGGRITGVTFYEQLHTTIIDFGLSKALTLQNNHGNSSNGASATSPGGFSPSAFVGTPPKAPNSQQQQLQQRHAEPDPFENVDADALVPLASGAQQQQSEAFPVATTAVGSEIYLSLQAVSGILGASFAPGSRVARWQSNTEELPKLDVFACGACIFACAMGRPPFRVNVGYRQIAREEKLRRLRALIEAGPVFNTQCSRAAKDFVTRLLDNNVSARPTAQQALQDPFVNHKDCVVVSEFDLVEGKNDNGEATTTVSKSVTQAPRLPREVARAVLADVAAASRNDFPHVFMLPLVRAAFAKEQHQQQHQVKQQEEQRAAAAAATAEVTAPAVAEQAQQHAEQEQDVGAAVAAASPTCAAAAAAEADYKPDHAADAAHMSDVLEAARESLEEGKDGKQG